MYRLLPLLLLLTVTACGRYQPADDYTDMDAEMTPNVLSQELLEGLRDGRDVSQWVKEIAELEPQTLAAALDTRPKKKRFGSIFTTAWYSTCSPKTQAASTTGALSSVRPPSP